MYTSTETYALRSQENHCTYLLYNLNGLEVTEYHEYSDTEQEKLALRIILYTKVDNNILSRSCSVSNLAVPLLCLDYTTHWPSGL